MNFPFRIYYSSPNHVSTHLPVYIRFTFVEWKRCSSSSSLRPLSFSFFLSPSLFPLSGHRPLFLPLPSPLPPTYRQKMLSLRLKTVVANRRALSTQARSVLSSLNIPTDGSDIPGVFNTRWTGSGEFALSLSSFEFDLTELSSCDQDLFNNLST